MISFLFLCHEKNVFSAITNNKPNIINYTDSYKALDAGNQDPHMVPICYADPVEIATTLNDLIKTWKRGKASYILPHGKTVVIAASKTDTVKLAEIIRKLDLPRRSFNLDFAFLEVSTSELTKVRQIRNVIYEN
jgi:type II secretory pathway component GspD/PulD (secretin)